LRARLSGGQWRILLWAVRATYGWNRQWTPFTWYRIAKETRQDRAATYRAGTALLRARVLVQHEAQISVQQDGGAWDSRIPAARTDDAQQLRMPGTKVAKEQRFPLPASNAAVALKQPMRCREATVLHRAKDSSKDRVKTYRDRLGHAGRAPHGRGGREDTERPHWAGAAKPIPGKYDSLSQN
jgi:phage replication O-like protein O